MRLQIAIQYNYTTPEALKAFAVEIEKHFGHLATSLDLRTADDIYRDVGSLAGGQPKEREVGKHPALAAEYAPNVPGAKGDAVTVVGVDAASQPDRSVAVVRTADGAINAAPVQNEQRSPANQGMHDFCNEMKVEDAAAQAAETPKAKRIRRTKAQIEADRLAEIAAANAAQAPLPNKTEPVGGAVVPNALTGGAALDNSIPDDSHLPGVTVTKEEPKTGGPISQQELQDKIISLLNIQGTDKGETARLALIDILVKHGAAKIRELKPEVYTSAFYDVSKKIEELTAAIARAGA